MAEKPDNAEARRRWYQFGLRTLLIGVTLLGVLFAYVAQEARIVAERKAWFENHKTPLFGSSRAEFPFAIGDPEQSPSHIRLWLGDRPEGRLWISYKLSIREKRSVAALFPEADIIEGWW